MEFLSKKKIFRYSQENLVASHLRTLLLNNLKAMKSNGNIFILILEYSATI